ncbi:MAG TPA: hypothetical protein VNU68_01110 [Verrucomicrobiae bacterium]|nr:hypothetical protein [Verrucomicrobiae bacterium]
MANYNYGLAFVEFCRGISLEDISSILNIPLKTLRTHARQNGWRKLADTLASRLAQSSTTPKAEQEIQRVRENRERNYQTAQKLREDLDRTVDALLDGSLRVGKVLSNGSQVFVLPSIKDRLELATYAKHVAELSYRALGDTVSVPGPDTAPQPMPTVQINLPAAVALPRLLRALPERTEGAGVS